MKRLPHHSRPKKLALDLVFFVWLSYAVVTGQILPDQVIGLFRNEPAAVVFTEPAITPGQIDLLNLDSVAPEA
jgi:hypothetical protein